MKSFLYYKPREHTLIPDDPHYRTNVLLVENADFDRPQKVFKQVEHIVLDYPSPGNYTTFILPEIEKTMDGKHVLAATLVSLDGKHRLNIINSDNMDSF